MTPEEILVRAADGIATHGHTKESFYAAHEDWETAPACAYGSMARVAELVTPGGTVIDVEGNGLGEAAKKLAATIRGKDVRYIHADDYQAITGYNDDDHTTAEDMILMMKEAANG